MNNQLDWNLVQVFLAVAATGSLTGAAKRLGLSQPTVGRQLRELEEVLGVPLVVRHSRGVALTHEGEELRETAMGVAVQMQALVRQASGTRTRVEGVVRISASDMVGTHVLMPTLAHIRTAWPGVVVELLLDDGPTDLLKGDADIAVRMFRPAGKELVARRVAQIAVGLFASASYLRQRPPIHTDDDLFEGEHSLIGYDRNLTMVQAFAQSEPRWTREATHFRVDSMLAQLEATRHGLGVSIQQLEVARRYPELVRVLPELPLPSVEAWLVTHADVRGAAHVRAVYDTLAAALSSHGIIQTTAMPST